MNKTVSLLAVLLILLQFGTVAMAEEEKSEDGSPYIEASSAILIEANSGRVFFEQNADDKRYPASTTKVMTAVLALEALDPAAVATASQTAVDVDRDGSNMGILSGEELTVEQLLYGLLVHSANDAANVLAEQVSGSIETFVELMNTKAAELGMKDTHFVNTHGYHDDNHYTTARDMAKLALYAVQNETFQKIVSTATYDIPPTNKYTKVRNLSNNNALINPMKGQKYLYSPAKGIKTGHTSKAGHCLLSEAEKNDLHYICVVMDAPVKQGIDYSFQDTINLFNYGFKNFKFQTIASDSDIVSTKEVKWAAKGEQAVLYAKEPFSVILPADYNKDLLTTSVSVPDEVKAPVAQGQAVGTITYSYDGAELGTMELVAGKEVKKSYFRMIFGTLGKIVFSVWFMVPLGIVVVILIILRMNDLKRKKMMRRRKKYMSRKNFYH